jgi:hypothetical protein
MLVEGIEHAHSALVYLHDFLALLEKRCVVAPGPKGTQVRKFAFLSSHLLCLFALNGTAIVLLGRFTFWLDSRVLEDVLTPFVLIW